MAEIWKLFQEGAVTSNFKLLPPAHSTTADYYVSVYSTDKFNYSATKII